MAEHSEEMQAAIAAMRAEWKQIGEEIMRKEDPEMPEDERDASLRRRDGMMRDFLVRHKMALEASGKRSVDAQLAALDAAKEKFEKADEAMKESQEALLQKSADVAEARQTVVEGLLDLLESMEAMPQEKWDAMEELDRVKAYETLRDLQAHREGFLAELPLARRQRWERGEKE